MSTTGTTTAKRHDERHVKIAHVSDLHFSAATVFPGEDSIRSEPFLEALLADVEHERPDLIAVTGDIADSGLIERARTAWRELRDTVLLRSKAKDRLGLCRETHERALRFLQKMCEAAQIDAGTQLIAVPGNHDYRIQGIGEQDPDLVAIFQDVYSRHFRSEHFWFDADGCPSISLSVAALDSNGGAFPVPLATGGLTEAEFRKLEIFDGGDASEKNPPIATFRVCLLHHHPLPVVPAEHFTEIDQSASLVDRGRDFFERLTGPQTTLLRNAGAFLWAVADRQVDLVLHGHEHHAWVSELRYPRAKASHRVLVAAAATAGAGVNRSFGYNIVTLGYDRRLLVTQKTLDPNAPHYERSRSYPDYDTTDLRLIRFRKATEELRRIGKHATPPLSGGPRPGDLRAARVARVNRLYADGNTRITRRFEELEAVDGAISKLPLTVISPGYTGLGSTPTVRRLDAGSGKIHTAVITKAGEMQLILQFEPPLEPERKVSFEVSYVLCNAFKFAEEEFRAEHFEDQSTIDGCEAVSSSGRMIVADRLSETVVFPEGWAPPSAPQVRVYDDRKQVDGLEQSYCERHLQYVEGEQLTTLDIELPLPGTTYEIYWQLPPRADHHKALYGRGFKVRLSRLESLALTPDVTQSLQSLLAVLRDELACTMPGQDFSLIDDTTELSLFLVRNLHRNTPKGPAMSIVLQRVAHLRASPAIADCGETIPAGVGVAGQSFASECILVDTSAGRSGIYTMLPGQNAAHRILCAVPLPVPATRAEKDKPKPFARPPIYAVLCLGAFEAGTGLEQLDDESGAIKLWLADWVIGRFNYRLIAKLLPAAAAPWMPRPPGLQLKDSVALWRNLKSDRVAGVPASVNVNLSPIDVWTFYSPIEE